MKRLRDHGPRARATPDVMAAAGRVFARGGADFVGLTPDQVRRRLGPPHEEDRLAGRPVWRYAWHDGEQGVVRNLWFDPDRRAVWGVEPIPTQ